MPPFFPKIREILTGKDKIERLQEKAASKVIRKDANAARLKARHEQAIKFAIASIAIFTLWTYLKRIDLTEYI